MLWDISEEFKATIVSCLSVVLANKSGLVDESFIENLSDKLSIEFKITTAKIGDNVDESFLTLAKNML